MADSPILSPEHWGTLGPAMVFTALATAVSWLAKSLISAKDREIHSCQEELHRLQEILRERADRDEKLAETRAAEIARLRSEIASLRALTQHKRLDR